MIEIMKFVPSTVIKRWQNVQHQIPKNISTSLQEFILIKPTTYLVL